MECCEDTKCVLLRGHREWDKTPCVSRTGEVLRLTDAERNRINTEINSILDPLKRETQRDLYGDLLADPEVA